MARIAYGATIGQELADGSYVIHAAMTATDTTHIASAEAELVTLTTNIAAAKAAITAVEADVAVLEADGASPTQAHVNALRVKWDILSAAVTALDASPVSGHMTETDTLEKPDVVLDLDTTAADCGNAIRSAVRAIMKRVDGTGFGI
jgi:hypothetical protein